MNEVDLKKRAEELEKTLQLQIDQLKKDSELWLKVGGVVLVVGLIAYGVVKKQKKRKDRRNFDVEEIAQPSSWSNRRKKGKSKSSSFFPPIKKRLLLSLFSLGQAKLMDELKKRKSRANEN